MPRSARPDSAGTALAASRQPHTAFRRWRARRSRIGVFAAMVAVALVAASCGGPAEGPGEGSGEEFPTRTITMIIPLPAGSAPDGTFRKLASIAEKDLGQEIIIVNKPGGSGTVGTVDVVKAEPDGYTIGMVGIAMLNLQPKVQNTAYEGPGDVTALVQVTEAAMSLFAKADSDIKTVDDLVSEAKSNPGKVTIGVAGARDLTDVEGRLLAREADADIKTVPMGPGKQVLGVLNGTVAAGIAQPLIVKPHVEGGKLRFLGIFGEQVPPGVDARLLKDQGYDVTTIPYEFLIAPKGMPDDVRDRLVKVFGDAVKSQEFQDFAKQGSLLASYLGHEELSAKLTKDDEAYADLIKEFGWS